MFNLIDIISKTLVMKKYKHKIARTQFRYNLVKKTFAIAYTVIHPISY